MDGSSLLSSPASVAVSIHSGRSRDETLARLAHAIADRRYSTPVRSSPGYFRLGGSVDGALVTLAARPYVTPGLVAGYGAMTIELRGEVVEREEGSDLRGAVTAPLSRTTPAFLVLALILWAAFGVASNGSTLPTWGFVILGSVLVAAAWVWIIRRNQQRALRNVDELTRMLTDILSADAAVNGGIPAR
jgi:hypothetical protein